jgi:hypothetical protein
MITRIVPVSLPDYYHYFKNLPYIYSDSRYSISGFIKKKRKNRKKSYVYQYNTSTITLPYNYH